jgi:hypothetical protein
LIVRHATAADIDTFYGSRPYQTVRALVADLNGKPVGLIGLARENGCSKIFSEYGPELKGRLKCMAILRAIKTVLRWAKESSLPVIAVAQPEEHDSPRVLNRLGFEFYGTGPFGDVYLWRN